MHAKFPPLLRRELAQHIHRETLLKLPVFNELRHPDRHNFMLELYMKMQVASDALRHAAAVFAVSGETRCLCNRVGGWVVRLSQSVALRLCSSIHTLSLTHSHTLTL
eukprot:1902057-Rhodomonas_salina.1